MSVPGIEADGRLYLACTNGYGTEYCVYACFAAPCYTNELAALLAGEGEEAEEAKSDWFRSFRERAGFAAYDAANEDAIESTDAIAIAWNIGQVLDWYREAFGRDSYDGKGGRVASWQFWNDSTEDIQSGLANAFWSPEVDENGDYIGNFFFGYDYTGARCEASFDTCAHELTHGVNSATADLQYEGEPGALNESFSDILAAACEFAKLPAAADLEKPDPGEADWLFDEDASGDWSEAARSFADPGSSWLDFKQPSRYGGKDWAAPAALFFDYGGVHANSGVQNHFFYLLCEGGRGWTGEKALVNDGVGYAGFDGIGVEKAAQIAYRVLTVYCRPRTDYREARECWVSAATDLEEDGELDAGTVAIVEKAWAAVMPFDELRFAPAGVDPGDKVVVVGLAKWDGETVKTADENGEISISVPVDPERTAFSYFRIADSLYLVANRGEGTSVTQIGPDLSDMASKRPQTSQDIRIVGIQADVEDNGLLIVAEIENGDEKASSSAYAPALSDLLRLRRSSTPAFGDDAEDLDIAKFKLPFVEEGADEPVPNKYNIVVPLPENAASGFYRLEW